MPRLLIAVVVLAALIVGCKISQPGETIEHEQIVSNTRFTAEFQSIFREAGTDRPHGIFIVTDTKTHAKYLAIEGCGVSVLQSYDDGQGNKTRIEQ